MLDPDPELPKPGDMVAGKYRIVSLIGEGGMGVVYKAHHQRLGQTVAIKMLRREVRHTASVVHRFEREARAAARLRSAHVARVIDVDTAANGVPFIVLEFLDGKDLGALLDERRQLPIAEAISYVLEACSAMAEAHELGIIHRDLKPSNLFLATAGGKASIKVLDFGISKTADENVSVTMTQSSLGTPMYMSPEQIRSAKGVDARTDVWSLGVILFELLTGTTPFHGESATAVVASVTADEPAPLRRLRPDAPDGLEIAISTALRKNPAERYQSIASLAEALVPFAATMSSWRPPSSLVSTLAAADLGQMNTVASEDSALVTSELTGLVELGAGDARPAVGAAPAATVATALTKQGALTEPGWTRATPEDANRSRRRIAVGLGLLCGAAAVGGALWLGLRSDGDAGTGVVAEPATPLGSAVLAPPAPRETAPDVSPALDRPAAAAPGPPPAPAGDPSTATRGSGRPLRSPSPAAPASATPASPVAPVPKPAPPPPPGKNPVRL